MSNLQGWLKNFAIFWYVQVCSTYITWLKQFKPWKVPSVVGSIMVICALTCCEMLHTMCDLKVTQMKMQRSLIQEVMFYKFKLGHNIAEAAKQLLHEVDRHRITRRFGNFSSFCNNIDDQASKGLLWTKAANLECSTQRVSGKLDISLSKVVYHFHDICKNIQWCWIVPHVITLVIHHVVCYGFLISFQVLWPNWWKLFIQGIMDQTLLKRWLPQDFIV